MTDTLSEISLNQDAVETIVEGKIVKFKKNPFVDNFYVKTRKKRIVVGGISKILVDTRTGEVEDVPHIARVWEVDQEQYVKIFTSMVKYTFELSSSGHKVFCIIIKTLSKTSINKDEIYLSWSEAEEFISSHKVEISQATFFRGLRECIKNGILARSSRENIYFINPKIVFNGDRTIFSTMLIKKRNDESRKIQIKQEKINYERKMKELENFLEDSERIV